MRLSPKTLVVLVGPSGAGKSHWAAANFPPATVVSSDALRALVGAGEHDQRAGTDAFELLDTIIARRLSRGLLTVVDTLGLDAARRTAYLDVARRHGFATVAVVFDTPAEVCRARNRARAQPVPPKVLTAQVAARDAIDIEGFDVVGPPSDVEVVGEVMVGADEVAAEQRRAPVTMRFGLHLSSFLGDGPLPDRLAEIVAVAEAVGFSSIWVMDHVVQIPQVGRPWEDMPESWTTLAWLAAHTHAARIGTLVTGVTLRNPAHLAKIVATLDVLSGGRVVCGLGAGWWEHEHDLYGWDFPSVFERYALLEDTLQLLPVMWGPGSPPFKGAVLSVPETICYPRPVQEHVPILVGGSGERRTLRLAAQHADACNLFGEPDAVRHKVEVLADHCESFGRDPSAVRVTHLSTAVVAPTRREVTAAVARIGAPDAIDRLGAGTIEDQIGRYRDLADAGVQTAMVALPDAARPGCLEAFGEVISAFPTGGSGW
ncbi:MAG: TIGR03560 family F420-dependent LLM class oxidoreductase [Acidimicrobiales bacterium]